MSLTLAPSASSLTPSRWTPTSWLGGSESLFQLQNQRKGHSEILTPCGSCPLISSPRLSTTGLYPCGRYVVWRLSAYLSPLARKLEPHSPSLEPGTGLESLIVAEMTGSPYHPVLFSHATCYTYHVCAVNSLTSVIRVKDTI